MLEEYGFISKKREKAEVNMGPLLDMVFILLIFFVITAQFTEDTGVTVERPGAPSATLQTSQPIYISLTSSGSMPTVAPTTFRFSRIASHLAITTSFVASP